MPRKCLPCKLQICLWSYYDSAVIKIYKNVVVLGYHDPFDLNGLIRQQTFDEETPFDANNLKQICHGNTAQT